MASDEEDVVIVEPPSMPAPELEIASFGDLPILPMEEGEDEIVLNPANKPPSASDSSDGGNVLSCTGISNTADSPTGVELGADISYSPKRSGSHSMGSYRLLMRIYI